MTLRSQITEAAFWDGSICLRCLYINEEGEELDGCPQCGNECFTSAKEVIALVETLERDEEEEY